MTRAPYSVTPAYGNPLAAPCLLCRWRTRNPACRCCLAAAAHPECPTCQARIPGATHHDEHAAKAVA